MNQRSWLNGRLFSYPVLVLAVAAVVAGFWPGYFNGDTVGQIHQLRTGEFTDWHSPLLMAAWRPFYHLGFGPGWLLTFTVAVVGVSCYALYRVAMQRLIAAICAGATLWYPPVLGFLGVLGRDAWFLGALLGTWASLVRATGRRGYARCAWLVMALFGALALVAARQNAIVCVPVVATAIVWLAGLDERLGRWPLIRHVRYKGRHGFVAGIIAVTFLVSAVVAVQRMAYVGLGVKAVHAEQGPMLYDLMQLSLRQRKVLLSPSYYPAQDLALLDQHVVPLQYDPMMHALRDPGPLIYPVPAAAIPRLHRDWVQMVLADPIEWLSTRWKLYERNLGWSGPTWAVYHVSVRDNPPEARPRFSGPTRWTWEYLDFFTARPNPTGGPLHRVWSYLVLTGVATRFLARGHRNLECRALALLGVASLLYNLGWFVGLMDLQYRFMFPNVAVGVIVSVSSATLFWHERSSARGRRNGDGGTRSAGTLRRQETH